MSNPMLTAQSWSYNSAEGYSPSPFSASFECEPLPVVSHHNPDHHVTAAYAAATDQRGSLDYCSPYVSPSDTPYLPTTHSSSFSFECAPSVYSWPLPHASSVMQSPRVPTDYFTFPTVERRFTYPNTIPSMSYNSKKRSGGRRPKEEQMLNPDEDHKRVLRRTRNKEAAARCRKRRLDHMNTLSDQVDALQEDYRHIEAEVEQLKQEKSELEYVLRSHERACKLRGVGTSRMDLKPMMADGQKTVDDIPQRPTSLGVGLNGLSDMKPAVAGLTSLAGIPIETPSAALFKFDPAIANLLEGSTGLTPTCNTGLTPLLIGGALGSGGSLETPCIESTSTKSSLQQL